MAEKKDCLRVMEFAKPNLQTEKSYAFYSAAFL